MHRFEKQHQGFYLQWKPDDTVVKEAIFVIRTNTNVKDFTIKHLISKILLRKCNDNTERHVFETSVETAASVFPVRLP